MWARVSSEWDSLFIQKLAWWIVSEAEPIACPSSPDAYTGSPVRGPQDVCDLTLELVDLSCSIEEDQVRYRCACGQDQMVSMHRSQACPSCGQRLEVSTNLHPQTASFESTDDDQYSRDFVVTSGLDRAGECLGHFRLLSKLGFGGMGAVYRALDESLQRFVAVKVIHTQGEGSTKSNHKQTTRLLDEAIAQARLSHPNVITIYYVGRDPEDPFLAMELLPGPTLAEKARKGPMPYNEVILFSRQICSALRKASRIGLVHGDIKPSNLVLASQSVVKLGDFGLAKLTKEPASKGIKGTLSYMAPEVAAGENPSEVTDIYSFGMTVFELAFGHRAYEIKSKSLLKQVDECKRAKVEFPEKWPKSLPEEFESVLRKMLAPDPSERYRSFKEVDKALAEIAPVGLVNASLLPRCLALITDYLFYFLLLLPIVSLLRVDPGTALAPIRTFAVAGLLVPFCATLWERSGRPTLGRYLFQLRLADAHGLLLSVKRSRLRSILRNAPIWLTAVIFLFLAAGLHGSAAVLILANTALMLISFLPVFGRKRLTLHDRIAGSHVVLNTVRNVT